MEVTEEMIAAVRAHEAAEKKREQDEYAREHRERQRAYEARLKAGALAQARLVFPELTEKDFEKLEEVFYSYLGELYDRW